MVAVILPASLSRCRKGSTLAGFPHQAAANDRESYSAQHRTNSAANERGPVRRREFIKREDRATMNQRHVWATLNRWRARKFCGLLEIYGLLDENAPRASARLFGPHCCGEG